MRNIINFGVLKIMKKMRNMSPDELKDALCGSDLRNEMASQLPKEELEIIQASDNIADITSQRISKFISKKHGPVSDVNAPTHQRRNDYYRLCLYVASQVLGRALAMYESTERDKLLEDFKQTARLNAELLRHGVEMKYRADDDEHTEE